MKKNILHILLLLSFSMSLFGQQLKSARLAKNASDLEQIFQENYSLTQAAI
jgi:hypothetical protein